MNLIIAASIVASLLIVFLAYILPLEQNQRLLLGIFDLAVVITLAVDYYFRLSASPNKRNFMLRQWYELPAMIPIIVFAYVDTSSVFQFIRFLALFRIVRLYRILYLLKGNGGELVAFAGISGMSIIFGAFAIYIAEAGMPDSAINNMYDAMWWSVETITTVAYGDYIPITPLGRIIATFMMFAAIAFLWTFIGILGNMIITRRVKKQKQEEDSDRVLDKTKEFIKDKINVVEKLDQEDLEILIRIIRSLNEKNGKISRQQ